jgi:hypothetical protein
VFACTCLPLPFLIGSISDLFPILLCICPHPSPLLLYPSLKWVPSNWEVKLYLWAPQIVHGIPEHIL